MQRSSCGLCQSGQFRHKLFCIPFCLGEVGSEGGSGNNGQRKRKQKETKKSTTQLRLRCRQLEKTRQTLHCESHSRHEASKVTEAWQVSDVWLVMYLRCGCGFTRIPDTAARYCVYTVYVEGARYANRLSSLTSIVVIFGLSDTERPSGPKFAE